MNRAPQSDQPSRGHAEALTGWTLQGHLNVDVFVLTQQRGVATRLNVIHVESGLGPSPPISIDNGDRGALVAPSWRRGIGFHPDHGSLWSKCLIAVEGEANENTVFDRKPRTSAALASFEASRLVDGKKQRDVAAA